MKGATDPNFERIHKPYRYEHADPELERIKQEKKRALNAERRRRPGRRKTGPQC
jgi:hypothetical protein